MKTINLFTFLLFISSFVFSQKFVDVKLVKMNDEIIQSRMKVRTNLFDRKLIDEASFYKLVVLIDENGKKKEKVGARDIKSLSFTNYHDEKVKYVNDGNQLQVLAYDGNKIKWFQKLNRHPMDGSISYFDYLVNKEGKVFNLGLFNHKKNKLKEALKDSPELVEEIESMRINYTNILEVLKKYDQIIN